MNLEVDWLSGSWLDHKSVWGNVGLSEGKSTLGDPFEQILSQLHVYAWNSIIFWEQDG